MSWIDRLSRVIKAFALGPAVVEPADTYWGKDPEQFSPPAYGDYLATSSAVYACATLRAKNLASLPMRAYRTVNGEQVEVTDGAFADLMRSVNPHWTYNRLLQMTELSLCLWGQAFWILERGPNGQGTPREIWWARPDRMRCVPDAQNYIAGWIYDWNNERLSFSPEEVIWFRYPNPLDEFTGLSPIASSRLAIDTAAGALQSNNAIFKNGLQIAAVVSPQDKETAWSREQVEQLRDNLERRFKGADKAHRLAVLGQAASFQTIGVSPKDAQFIELMKWSRGDVASVFAVPPELIGDHEHATYSNIEQAYKAFWTDALIPEAAMIASEITEQMLKFFPEVDYVEFDTQHISALQPDKASLVEQAAKWVAMGVPLNKVLSEIAPHLLPESGAYEWGDRPMAAPMPLPDNTQEATRAVKKNGDVTRRPGFIEFGSPEHIAAWKAFERQARPIEARIQAIVSDIMQEQADEIVAAIAKQTAKGVYGSKKALTPDDIDALWDGDYWQSVFEERLMDQVQAAAEAGGTDAFRQLKVRTGFNLDTPDGNRFVLGRTQRFAEEVNDTTWNQLREGIATAIDEGRTIAEIEEIVQQTMGDRIRSSAETIARTETIGALNGGALLGAKQSGVDAKKTWIAALDQRTRETHDEAHVTYNANPIPLDADFEVGEGAGQAPGQIGLPEEDINCRCAIGWAFDDDEQRGIIDDDVARKLQQFVEG
jgi:HK97 family phage portal protein